MDREERRHKEEDNTPVKYSNQYQMLNDMKTYFGMALWKQLPSDWMNTLSIIDKKDQDRIRFSNIFYQMKLQNSLDPKLLQLGSRTSKAIACFLGLGICDAFGASTQFVDFVKDRRDLIENDFNDIKKQIKNHILDPRSGRVGIWTDDCSMALCMADSLLLKKFKFDPQHMRYLFILWIQNGLNNGGRPHSIGLGGNISISMKQFVHKQTDYCEEGEAFNNGNGSLMRLAPIPICFLSDEQEAMKFAGLQSRTTHNGKQAKECCRLLTSILIRLINRKQHDQWTQVIDKACKQFETPIKTVKCLALSKQEPVQLFEEQKKLHKEKFTKFNKKLQDRNWNWKDPQFTYSPWRAKKQPDYIGSYCMDALSMALHTVWHTKSFKEMALMNANMGGDCDTVGAIAGQIAGAIYGIDEDMLKLYSQMVDYESGQYQLFLKAFKLATRSNV